MDIKTEKKLTANKANQFNQFDSSNINLCDMSDSLNLNRKTIKIKSKNPLFLTEGQNYIKTTKSNNNIQFPKIKIKHNSKFLNINNNFMNNIQTLERSNSFKTHIQQDSDYININSLFSYNKSIIKRNIPLKFNYSISIDIPKNRRLLNIKNLKLNTPKSINSKIHPIKLNINKKNDQLYEIKNFMKMKYYEDIKTKLEKKLKDDSFFDKGDKDKLIKIGRFKIFWKNVLDYCGGYLFSQHYKDLKKANTRFQNTKNETTNKIKLQKKPGNTIYTNILKSKLIHYKNNL